MNPDGAAAMYCCRTSRKRSSGAVEVANGAAPSSGLLPVAGGAAPGISQTHVVIPDLQLIHNQIHACRYAIWRIVLPDYPHNHSLTIQQWPSRVAARQNRHAKPQRNRLSLADWPALTSYAFPLG
jgi:hypothetical protein